MERQEINKKIGQELGCREQKASSFTLLFSNLASIVTWGEVGTMSWRAGKIADVIIPKARKSSTPKATINVVWQLDLVAEAMYDGLSWEEGGLELTC